MNRIWAGIDSGKTHHQWPSTVTGARGKTGARDALVIADQARVRRDLQPLRPSDEATIELRLLANRRTDLVRDRTRAINWLRSTLTGMLPALERTLILTSAGREPKEDPIGRVDRGVYVVGDWSWSIDMQRYNFHFTSQHLLRIENVGPAGQLRDAAYQATTTDFWWREVWGRLAVALRHRSSPTSSLLVHKSWCTDAAADSRQRMVRLRQMRSISLSGAPEFRHALA